MDSWKDQGYHYSPEVTRTRYNCYRKPPSGGGDTSWQQTVPSWEKKFCSSVGSMSWNKILETKKSIHLYDNIIKWNDSAGKEAFEKAKNNFYANMHNLPSDSRLPDADIYIDKINWDSEVDENLMLDLDSDYVVPDSNSKDEQVVIFGSSFPPSYQNFSTYGWGDSDDDKKKGIASPGDDICQRETKGGGFDRSGSWRARNENSGCGDSRNDYWGWNMYDDNNCFYDDARNEPKDGSGSRYMSRYKTSRFRKDNGSAQNNGSRRKSSYSFAKVNPSSVAHRWSVKKPVS